jgi:TonB family protein
MRRPFPARLALAFALSATPALAQRIVAIVAPDYPPAALQAGETATLDVAGRVNADGSLALATLQIAGGSEAFVNAVKQAAPYWVFQPPIDAATCESRAGEVRMRVWFEMAGGKPKVSVSPPSDPQAPAPNAFGEVTRKAGKVPFYPKAAQEKGLEGEMFAVAKVDRTGQVWNVHLRPGLNTAVFGPPTYNALMKWQFDVAGYPEGKPHICVEVPVDFKLKFSKIEAEGARLGRPVRVQ